MRASGGAPTVWLPAFGASAGSRRLKAEPQEACLLRPYRESIWRCVGAAGVSGPWAKGTDGRAVGADSAAKVPSFLS